MAKRTPGAARPDGPAAVLAQIEQLARGMNVEDVRALTGQLLGLGGTPTPWDRPPVESRRRPRQETERTYRVRIDLAGAKPPIWRRLEVSSHLTLDDLHLVIQEALGWTDSHLHRFAVGRSSWDRDAEMYLCPYDVEEGEDSDVPEVEVRLDEVLVDPGDVLHYVYDYGDDWEHTIRLEAASNRAPDSPIAVCVAGRRAGPPEDCGGIHGYEEMLAAAADPSNERHDEAVEYLSSYLGGTFDPVRLDLEEINRGLRAGLDRSVRAGYHATKLASSLYRVQGYASGAELLELLRAARLDCPVELDEETAAPTLQRLTWLLRRIGPDGIKLTAAGYLPPAVVRAAMVELDLTDEWIGAGNREDLTYPVLELREMTQKLGLARKYRGRLELTPQARRLMTDPVALWWHVAGRLPLSKPDSSESVAGLVVLVGVAAGRAMEYEHVGAFVAEVLHDVGWRHADGNRISDGGAYGAARDTIGVLRHLRVFEQGRRPSRDGPPTPAGRALARAALTAG